MNNNTEKTPNTTLALLINDTYRFALNKSSWVDASGLIYFDPISEKSSIKWNPPMNLSDIPNRFEWKKGESFPALLVSSLGDIRCQVINEINQVVYDFGNQLFFERSQGGIFKGDSYEEIVKNKFYVGDALECIGSKLDKVSFKYIDGFLVPTGLAIPENYAVGCHRRYIYDISIIKILDSVCQQNDGYCCHNFLIIFKDGVEKKCKLKSCEFTPLLKEVPKKKIQTASGFFPTCSDTYSSPFDANLTPEDVLKRIFSNKPNKKFDSKNVERREKDGRKKVVVHRDATIGTGAGKEGCVNLDDIELGDSDLEVKGNLYL